MKAERFEQFTLSIDLLQKCIKHLKLHYAPSFDMKGVHTFWVYLLLSHPEGLTPAELAAKSMINRSLVSREIAELEEKGYVTSDSQGKRGYNHRIRLTPRGQAAALGIAAKALEIQTQADTGIAPEELESFYATLDKLCTNFATITENLFMGDTPDSTEKE